MAPESNNEGQNSSIPLSEGIPQLSDSAQDENALIWIVVGDTVKFLERDPSRRPYIERSQSATRRIGASCLGICFIPQVINFAQTALAESLFITTYRVQIRQP